MHGNKIKSRANSIHLRNFRFKRQVLKFKLAKMHLYTVCKSMQTYFNLLLL